MMTRRMKYSPHVFQKTLKFLDLTSYPQVLVQQHNKCKITHSQVDSQEI